MVILHNVIATAYQSLLATMAITHIHQSTSMAYYGSIMSLRQCHKNDWNTVLMTSDSPYTVDNILTGGRALLVTSGRDQHTAHGVIKPGRWGRTRNENLLPRHGICDCKRRKLQPCECIPYFLKKSPPSNKCCTIGSAVQIKCCPPTNAVATKMS